MAGPGGDDCLGTISSPSRLVTKPVNLGTTGFRLLVFLHMKPSIETLMPSD
jgi:hypothetical protein